MNKYVLPAFTVGIIAIAYFFFLNEEIVSDTTDNFKTSLALDKHPSSQPIRREKVSSQQINISSIELENCDSKHIYISQDWFKQLNLTLPSLYQEHDPIMLSMALMLLENPGMGHHNLVRGGEKDRNYLVRKQQFPNDLFPPQLSLQEIKALSNMNGGELKNVTNNIGLLINEVTMALDSQQFDNSQLINLMHSLIDINGHGYDMPTYSQKYFTILESIIAQDNEELFFSFLELGGHIPSYEIGVNALERWFLTHASKVLKAGESEDSFRLLEYLINLGLPIRAQYNLGAEDSVEVGAYHTLNFQNSKLFNELVARFNLSVESAPTLDALKSNQAVMGIHDKLLSLKNDFYINQHGFSLTNVDACINKAKFLYEKRNGRSLVEQAKSKYQNEQLLVIDELASIDPTLVDCYIEELPKDRSPFTVRDETVKLIIKDFANGDTDAAIEKMEVAQLAPKQLTLLFWKTLMAYPEQFETIVARGARPFDSDYRHAGLLNSEQFSRVTELGFLFDGPSKYNRSMIDFAASWCNIELVNHLYKENYQVNFGSAGSDALGIAILTNCHSDQRKFELVQLFMKNKHPISSHHKDKMARLRLENFKSYQLITSKYPELVITEDQNLSYSFCTL